MSNSTIPKKSAAANKNRFAAAKRPTLLAQYRAAKDALTRLDGVVYNLLDGQGGIGRRATQAAYAFTIACFNKPAQAAKLPGWADAAVQPGTNPYGQPLKMLADDMSNIIQAKISIWAKVFRDAHTAKIKPEHFLEHLKRNHGIRRWYDSINMVEKAANDNGKNAGLGRASGAGGKANSTPKPKARAPAPVDIAKQVKDTKHIIFAIIDKNLLLCDGDAIADLESNPAFIGLVKATHTKCRKFVNDNDPRFLIKGEA